ncbi:hypothetical protein BV22DRAFT_1129788 [Leucogyrophana mollusca]|uniref:Uncharacterized protein n=1 Tax=Leucogyrophana mollusca TaxID=85980 RepID=A0ACB8BF81_9AGAM|nr:hypothetical protein BV22DRAFT_1129788 [Leucogyrophana mollusca]
MSSLYDPSDLAAATDLRKINYVYGNSIVFIEPPFTSHNSHEVSVAAAWTLDYMLQLGDEIAFLGNTKWGKVKVLYCLARYVPFFLIGMNLYQSLKANLNPEMCHPLYEAGACLSGVSLVCSECIFFLRAYALWARNRKVLLVLSCSLVVLVVAVIVVLFTYQSSIKFTVPPVPVITGCYRTGQDNVLFIAYLLLLVFELGAVEFAVCLTPSLLKRSG